MSAPDDLGGPPGGTPPPIPSPDDHAPETSTVEVEPEGIQSNLPPRGDDTAKIDLGLTPSPLLPHAPVMPKPKPIITPERTANGFRTRGVEIRRDANSFYVQFELGGRAHTIHVTPSQLDGLVTLAQGPEAPGALWRRLSEIPLERPLPNRALEDELRALLLAFGAELRQRRR